MRLSIAGSPVIEGEGRVSFQLDNAGEVPVHVGDSVRVERWNGETWVEVDEQDYPNDRRVLEAGEGSSVLRWPDAEVEVGTETDAGWHRIAMTAWTQHSTREVVHARFEVRPTGSAVPPEEQDVGVVHRETSHGIAAAELIIEPRKITSTGSVSVRLVNRGELTLGTGYGFDVERWDGRSWIRVPPPDGTSWPDIGIILGPGDDTGSKMRFDEEWPYDSNGGEPVETGWYRVTKRASIKNPGNGTSNSELSVRALFRVVDP